jgi:hypothetical protein
VPAGRVFQPPIPVCLVGDVRRALQTGPCCAAARPRVTTRLPAFCARGAGASGAVTYTRTGAGSVLAYASGCIRHGVVGELNQYTIRYSIGSNLLLPLPRRRAGWEWGCRSAGPSSMPMVAGCGQMQMNPDDDARARALKAGIICYLRKPVDEDRLKRCLRAALNS